MSQGGLRDPPIRSIVTSVQTNHMSFIETLESEGYVFNDEDFDGCYVKQDENGFYHLYQEGEDDGEWNYVQMSPLFDVVKEYTVEV